MCIILSLSPIIYIALYAIGWFSGGVCQSKRRLDGKIVVITGGDSGIGYETALDLAKRGARIIMGCLDKVSGEVAAQKIRFLSSEQSVEVVALDLTKLSSVRKFVVDVDKLTTKVDILVNNAGSKPIFKCSNFFMITLRSLIQGEALIKG